MESLSSAIISHSKPDDLRKFFQINIWTKNISIISKREWIVGPLGVIIYDNKEPTYADESLIF